MQDGIRLATPWAIYAGRVEKLFEPDPRVRTEYDDDSETLTLRVDGEAKAEAIAKLLPQSVKFGNVTLRIAVVPSNAEQDEADVYRAAFSGNPAFVDVAEGFGPAHDVSYAMFAPEVAQLQEDDISKYGGMTTITYEQLAHSVLEKGDIRICSARK